MTHSWTTYRPAVSMPSWWWWEGATLMVPATETDSDGFWCVVVWVKQGLVWVFMSWCEGVRIFVLLELNVFNFKNILYITWSRVYGCAATCLLNKSTWIHVWNKCLGVTWLQGHLSWTQLFSECDEHVALADWGVLVAGVQTPLGDPIWRGCKWPCLDWCEKD